MSTVTPPMRQASPRCPEHQHGPLLSLSPTQSVLPNDSACYEVSKAAGPKPSVVAAQRGRRHGGVLRGRPRLRKDSSDRSRSLTTGWWMNWTPVLWIWTPAAHRTRIHHFGGQLPDEVQEAPIVGVAAGFGAQQCDSVVGDLVPCHRRPGCLRREIKRGDGS